MFSNYLPQPAVCWCWCLTHIPMGGNISGHVGLIFHDQNLHLLPKGSVWLPGSVLFMHETGCKGSVINKTTMPAWQRSTHDSLKLVYINMPAPLPLRGDKSKDCILCVFFFSNTLHRPLTTPLLLPSRYSGFLPS